MILFILFLCLVFSFFIPLDFIILFIYFHLLIHFLCKETITRLENNKKSKEKMDISEETTWE